MIKLIICLLIVIITYITIIKIIYGSCSNNDVRIIDRTFGSKINGTGFTKKLGFSTINLKLDNSLPCGFYTASTHFGDATLIIGKSNQSRADVYFEDISKVESIGDTSRYEFWNILKNNNINSDVINIYNTGCCGSS